MRKVLARSLVQIIDFSRPNNFPYILTQKSSFSFKNYLKKLHALHLMTIRIDSTKILR